MPRVVIWGAAGHAKVLHEALGNSDAHIVAVVDNRELASPIVGVPVFHGEPAFMAWLAQQPNHGGLLFAVAIGGARGTDRLQIFDLMKRRGLEPLTIIHRTAFVAADAVVGEGCQVLANAAVCANACLGRAVIINTAASVDHDCVVGDGVHVAPGARLAGEVVVETRAFVGLGAVVLPRLHIGADAIVGAGAVVTRDVEARSTVVGNPARAVMGRASVEQQPTRDSEHGRDSTV